LSSLTRVYRSLVSARYWSEGQNWARHRISNRWQEETAEAKSSKRRRYGLTASVNGRLCKGPRRSVEPNTRNTSDLASRPGLVPSPALSPRCVSTAGGRRAGQALYRVPVPLGANYTVPCWKMWRILALKKPTKPTPLYLLAHFVRVRMGHRRRRAFLTSYFACCSLWPVFLPRWTRIAWKTEELCNDTSFIGATGWELQA
jgi:hypothetical protein